LKINPWFSIRWKIISLFILSIFLSAGIVGLLISVAYEVAVYNRDSWFYNLLYDLRLSFGTTPIAVITAIILVVLFFSLLSRSVIRYLEKISAALQEISLGRFNMRIPVESADELGVLAQNINNMMDRLQEAVEEERNAERSKNELITSVSHDLRTPLTSVLGYLELIENDRYKDEVELRYYISVAYDKARRLQKLIDDLFEYTKVSGGGLKLKSSLIDLRELLEQLAEEFVPALQAEGMQSRLYIAEDRYLLQADGDLLVRVFENLVANAIRYGREGKYIDIELENNCGWIIARVINYGEPISKYDLPHIFDRF
jgi:signal transduction histidine kinase